MPNRYAEERFREGKCMAAIALIKALEKEKLPRERGHFFKTGRIETYLDLDSPLQPRALLAVLRDAKVPHDNNCRFRPLAIYEGLEDLRPLPHQYLFGPPPDQAPVVRKVDPGMEEPGDVEGENVQGGGDVTADGTAAETRIDPFEATSKPEVEPGQGAVAVPRRRERALIAFEGISTFGQRILRVTPLGKPIPYYVVDMGIDSAGRRRHKRIGHERPPLLSTMEQPQAKRLDGQKVKTSRGGESRAAVSPWQIPRANHPSVPIDPE